MGERYATGLINIADDLVFRLDEATGASSRQASITVGLAVSYPTVSG